MTRYRYNHESGEVEEVTQEAPRVDAHGVSVRFRPHVTYQIHKDDAKALGLKRTKNKGTVIQTEKQLNEYLARERAHGWDTQWKDT